MGDGTAVTQRAGAGSYDLTSFRSFEVNLDITREIGGARDRPSDMPLSALIAAARSSDPETRLDARIELHRKVAFACAALLLALAGVPFAVPMSRSVYARGFAVTVAFALAYYFSFGAAVVAVPYARVVVGRLLARLSEASAA